MVKFGIHLLLAGVCLAQPPANGSATGRFLREVGGDQAALLKAPLKLTQKKWLATALPIVGATTVLLLTDTAAVRSLPNTPDQISVSKAISNAGTLYTLGAGVVGTALVAKLAGKPEAVRTSVLAGRSLISAAALTYSIKFAAGRERPSDNDEGRFWKAKNSFPSGHAVASWAVATTIARRPDCPKWLAITSYVAAGAVSLSRIGAQKHFPADVFVGSTLGILIGARMARQP